MWMPPGELEVLRVLPCQLVADVLELVRLAVAPLAGVVAPTIPYLSKKAPAVRSGHTVEAMSSNNKAKQQSIVHALSCGCLPRCAAAAEGEVA